jgi:nicotinamide mononucleotide transporter
MSTIEIIAVFFAILYVILAAKESIWCWLAAIISVILYTRICYSAQLYPETGLQIFYLAMAIYGYIQWNKPKKDTIIISWTKQKHLIVIIINSLISLCLGYYFDHFTEAKLPYIDSATTIFSISTTYMVTKKVIENWIYWIVIDLASIYLYYNRDLNLSAGLFGLYVILAAIGYIQWKKKMA